jgi:hypothetical protein|tara:strand:+ start:3745 stop:3900 length:156 start_codon:yes stop_codon:yes gene_type:complete
MYKGLQGVWVDNIEKTRAPSIAYRNNDKVNKKYDQLLYTKKETRFLIEKIY